MNNTTHEAKTPMTEGTTNEATTIQTEEPANAIPDTAPAALADDIKPDPLLTPALEMSDEERELRSRPEGHRRLNRKHKPPITAERFAELQARVDEVVKLNAELLKVKLDLVRREKHMAEATSIVAEEDARCLIILDQACISELEARIKRRALEPVDAIQYRLAKRNGLLSDRDIQAIQAAGLRNAARDKRRAMTPIERQRERESLAYARRMEKFEASMARGTHFLFQQYVEPGSYCGDIDMPAC